MILRNVPCHATFIVLLEIGCKPPVDAFNMRCILYRYAVSAFNKYGQDNMYKEHL